MVAQRGTGCSWPRTRGSDRWSNRGRDRGLDTRTSVNEKDYQVPFPFNGKIDKLTFNLGPMQLSDKEKQTSAQAIHKAKD